MKKFLAYIFLFIFSFQVLPVKEIGQILFKGLMTEEIHETVDETSGNSKVKKEPAKLYFKAEALASAKYLTRKIQIAIHESESLPRHFVPDILTPPPNHC